MTATPTKIAGKDLNVELTIVQNALREKIVVTGSPMKTAASREWVVEGILQNLVQIVHKDTVRHGVTATVFGPIMSVSMHKV